MATVNAIGSPDFKLVLLKTATHSLIGRERRGVIPY